MVTPETGQTPVCLVFQETVGQILAEGNLLSCLWSVQLPNWMEAHGCHLTLRHTLAVAFTQSPEQADAPLH